MKSGDFKVVFDNTAKFLEGLKVLATEVMVGIPAAATERKEDDGQEFNNAAIGYINENGSDLAGIPPRPHLVPGIRLVQKDISDEYKKAAQLAFSNPEQAKKHFVRAGIIATNSVKKVITDQYEFTPLSDVTIGLRKKAGFAGDKALIRTGQYRNAITYVLSSGE
jgi:hypothetical protein